MSKLHWLILIISLSAFPLLFSFLLIFNLHVINTDGIQYIHLGYNLFHFGEYSSGYEVVMPDWIQPPVFPVLAGLVSLLMPIQWSGIITALIFYGLILYLIYRFVKDSIPFKYSWIAVFLFGANPLILFINTTSLSEAVFTFFHFGIFILLYIIFFRKQNNIKIFILLGIAAALLTLTRPEGLLFSISLFLFLIVRFRNILRTAISIITFMVLVLPYGLIIQSYSGEFNLAPKITYNQRLGHLIRWYETQKPGFNSVSDFQTHIGWYAYDPDLVETYSSSIMDDEYYLNLKIQHSSGTSLSGFIKHIFYNFIEVLRVFIRSNPFPEVFFIFLVIGFLVTFLKFRPLFLLMVFWILPTFYFILSHVEERFFYVMLPYFSIFAFTGISFLYEKIHQKYQRWFLITAIIALQLNFIYCYIDTYRYNKSMGNYYQLSGELKNYLPDRTPVSTLDAQITFWGNFRFTKLPLCNCEELTDFLNARNTRYLILDAKIYRYRPELVNIYENQCPEKYEEVAVFEINGSLYKLFKLKTGRS